MGHPLGEAGIFAHFFKRGGTLPPDRELDGLICNPRQGRRQGWQARIGNNNVGETIGVICHHAQPHHAAPILPEEGRVFQIKRRDQFPHHVHMALMGVIILFGVFV